MTTRINHSSPTINDVHMIRVKSRYAPTRPPLHVVEGRHEPEATSELLKGRAAALADIHVVANPAPVKEGLKSIEAVR